MTKDSFGPLIAYLVPGATALAGFSYFSPVVRSWFAAGPASAPTIGGFLYLTVAAIAAGMTVSAIRWAVVDHLHAWTGLPAPKLDFSKLSRNVTAFTLLIEIHYQHYQFYANMFVASAIAYVCYRVNLSMPLSMSWIDAGFVTLETIFYCTSRDTLGKYYVRSQQLLAKERVPSPSELPTASSSTAVPDDRQTGQASLPESGRPPAAE